MTDEPLWKQKEAAAFVKVSVSTLRSGWPIELVARQLGHRDGVRRGTARGTLHTATGGGDA